METDTTPRTVSKSQYEPTGTDRIRQRFETAAELANDGLLVCDQTGKISYASTTASRLLGYARAELTNRSVKGLLSLADQRNFDILRQEALSQPGQALTTEAAAVPAWGQALEVEITVIAAPQGDELFISFRDLSLSKIMEKELLKSNQFLRKIIMGSVDGIMAADVSGNIMLFNEGAVRMLGWTESEVIGVKAVADFLEPGMAKEIQIRLHRDDPRDGPVGSMNPMEVNMVARSGEIIPVNMSVSSIVEWGQEVATVGIFTDLRERVKMERALKETRDYLNNVLENAFDMIITTDLNTNIVSFNRGAERLLGYRRDEVLGISVESFYPDAEERRALMRRMEHFDGVVTNYETRLKRKDGVLVDISMTLSLLYDNSGKIIGTVGISKDITARKRAERELQETKDYLNAIVENAPDMIITTNLEKNIVSFNRGAEKILGYQRDEVLGKHIETLYVEPGERQALAKYLDSQTTSVNYETQLRAKDRRVVDIDLTLSHLKNKDGRVIGTLGISKDITEKKRVEAELEQKKEELEEAQLQIMHAEKMASLGKLATSVAHEINNPLGGILLFCEMILEEIPEDDANRPDLMQIREQTLRCKEIVKGLLEFGRMTDTHYSFIEINRTVEQGIALFANQAILQDIEIVRDLDPKMPQIMGDASQLNQVFTNLIINAVDAMEGKGILTISTRLDEEAEEVLVSVGDTGQGIDPEVRPRLFEPFFTTKPVGEGVGLGLSTSYGIVKRHNGRIEVESEPGKGSVFTVHLPIDGPEQE